MLRNQFVKVPQGVALVESLYTAVAAFDQIFSTPFFLVLQEKLGKSDLDIFLDLVCCLVLVVLHIDIDISQFQIPLPSYRYRVRLSRKFSITYFIPRRFPRFEKGGSSLPLHP